MAAIYESKNFFVYPAEHPHLDREEGGHIVIIPKVRVSDRQHLTPQQAVELMRLTIVVGEAMTTVMNQHGVDVGRINYMDCGNWSVFKPGGSYLHIHLYGRAKSAKINTYGQAIHFPHMDEKPGYYKSFKPLTKKDIKDMNIEIERLLKEDKFSDSQWGLKRK